MAKHSVYFVNVVINVNNTTAGQNTTTAKSYCRIPI